MQRIGDMLPEIKPREFQPESKTIKCKMCGLNIIFGERQWKIVCGCGNEITRSGVSAQIKEEEKKDTCGLCRDLGVVYYWVQYDEQMYQFVARCVCQAGEDFKNIPTFLEANNCPESIKSKVWRER
jgi:hypothetical protein